MDPIQRIGCATIATLCLMAWAPGAAHAGPWTRSPGSGYQKLSQGVYVAEGFRDASGRFVDDSTYVGHSTALYAELGLVKYIHAQLYLPFIVATNAFDRDSSTRLALPCEQGFVTDTMRRGFGDAQLGIQFDPNLLPLPHAIRLEGKFPLYDVTEPDGRCGDLFPQPGDGQVDATLWASIGRSFLKGDVFAFLELGHRERTDLYLFGDGGLSYARTFVAAVQGGYQLRRDTFAMFSLRVELPYRDDERSRAGVTMGPQLIVPIVAGLAFELDVGFTPWSRNGSQGRSGQLYWTQVTVGISHKH